MLTESITSRPPTPDLLHKRLLQSPSGLPGRAQVPISCPLRLMEEHLKQRGHWARTASIICHRTICTSPWCNFRSGPDALRRKNTVSLCEERDERVLSSGFRVRDGMVTLHRARKPSGADDPAEAITAAYYAGSLQFPSVTHRRLWRRQ